MDKELKAYKDLDVRRTPTTPDSIYFVLNSTTQKVTEIWITSSQNIPKRVELNNSVVSGNISQFVNDAGYLTIGALPKTKLQYNTSLIDGDFLFVGDANVYTDENAQDAVGTILVDSAEIDFTYNDATPSITASIKAGSIDETKLDLSVNNSLNLANSALQSVALTNYFNKTVDDTDDVVEGLTNKFTTIAEKNKISQITVTQPVNLDTIESDVAGKENTANKVSTITPSATNFPNNNAVIAYVASNTPIIQDATTTVKGIVKLAGDLGGTADLPTTPTAVHLTGDETVSGIKTFLAGMFGLRNIANTFTSFFANANTASRTYTLQDRSGTLADLTNIATKQDVLVSGTNIKTLGGVSLLGSGDLPIPQVNKNFNFFQEQAFTSTGLNVGKWTRIAPFAVGSYDDPTTATDKSLIPVNGSSRIYQFPSKCKLKKVFPLDDSFYGSSSAFFVSAENNTNVREIYSFDNDTNIIVYNNIVIEEGDLLHIFYKRAVQGQTFFKKNLTFEGL